MKSSACQVVVVKFYLLFQKQKIIKTDLKKNSTTRVSWKKNEALAAVLELREDEISADNDEDTII